MKSRLAITFLIIVLTACKLNQPMDIQSTAIVAAKTSIMLTQTSQPTAISMPPTSISSHQTIEASSETTSVAALTPTLLSPLDKLRMAYVIDGNIYLQDGTNSRTKLTKSGKDFMPLFSNDGQKITYLHGDNPKSLYSINADGSSEKVMATNSTLITNSTKYDESTTVCDRTFVPGTHFLLFGTCSYPDTHIIIHNGDLFIADTDSNETKVLLSPRQANSYHVSPDGSMIAIDTENHIDILSITGEIIRRNLITYTLSKPIPLSPAVSWTSDSRGLNVALPIDTFYDDSYLPPAYTIWRYSLDDSKGIQINLTPSPMGHNEAKFSPDGNWVIYNNYKQGSFYIGDLRENRVQLYEPHPGVYIYSNWSPDNIHFVYEIAAGRALYLGSSHEPSILIGKGHFLGWLNERWYLYYADSNILIRSIDGEVKPILFNIDEVYLDELNFTFVCISSHTMIK